MEREIFRAGIAEGDVSRYAKTNIAQPSRKRWTKGQGAYRNSTEIPDVNDWLSSGNDIVPSGTLFWISWISYNCRILWNRSPIELAWCEIVHNAVVKSRVVV